MVRLKSALTAVFLGLATLASADNLGLQITDAYARGTAASGAVFLKIDNLEPTEDRLLSVTSDVADMVAMHSSEMDANGVMTMPAAPDGFAIPANSSFALARGGSHIMLMGLTRAMTDGDTIHLTLMFERAGAMEIDVIVDNKRKE